MILKFFVKKLNKLTGSFFLHKGLLFCIGPFFAHHCILSFLFFSSWLLICFYLFIFFSNFFFYVWYSSCWLDWSCHIQLCLSFCDYFELFILFWLVDIILVDCSICPICFFFFLFSLPSFNPSSLLSYPYLFPFHPDNFGINIFPFGTS